jgi:S1-C subfamily serine protease
MDALEIWGFDRYVRELESQLANVRIPASPPPNPPPVEEIEPDSVAGYGTCFAVGPMGTIVTANHVVEGGLSVQVTLASGISAIAEVVAFSGSNDVAVLSIPIATPDYLNLAEPRSLSVGDPVFTMGFPVVWILGSEPKFSEGSVSSLSGIGGEGAFLQISVPVQPGNSGGPLVNASGEVVGIISSTAATLPFMEATGGTAPQNINWAVNIDFARPLIDSPTNPTEPTLDRGAAIEKTRQALCLVETLLSEPQELFRGERIVDDDLDRPRLRRP